MAEKNTKELLAEHTRNAPSFSLLLSLGLIIAALYWTQAFLIPVALALLLTFLLTPVTAWLEKFGWGRVAAVLLVVVFVFSLLGTVAWIVAAQFTAVANQLPAYRNNIKQKIADIRGAGKGGALEKVKETAKEVSDELSKEQSKLPKPREVVVQSDEAATLWPSSAAQPMLERVAGAGFVIVLVIFMSIRRENLRNRFIRLLGYSRLTITTRALEESGRRISRYLVMQSLINLSFGIAVGVALFLIGLPYAFLWGFLATLLRFIPYIGSWAAAILPTALSLAVFQGWLWPMLVLGIIIALEIVSAAVLEPLLYGDSAGVSEVGLLVSIAFWTWLWGPVGLLLALPITVCVVVISKYVPQLEFIWVLLSDDPIIEPEISYYQRLLAMDRDEAREIIEDYLKSHSADQVYDDLMVPALSYAKRDVLRGTLTEAEEQFVFQTTREIIASLQITRTGDVSPADNSTAGDSSPAVSAKLRIMGCPARDESDEIALLMFSQLLDRNRFEIELVGEEALASEVIEQIAEKNPPLFCIASLSPDGLTHTRALCKRVRLRFPDIKILIGRLGSQGAANIDNLLSAGADKIGTTILELRDQVAQLSQTIAQ